MLRALAEAGEGGLNMRELGARAGLSHGVLRAVLVSVAGWGLVAVERRGREARVRVTEAGLRALVLAEEALSALGMG